MTEKEKLIRFRRQFWKYVKTSMNGCWEWQGYVTEAGYGAVKHYQGVNKNQYRSAHRVAFELTFGPVADGLVLDHLCENKTCVNPAHLEAVTHKTNLLRSSRTQAHINKNKTHCVRGHPLTGANVYQTPRGSRQCVPCRVVYKRAWRRCNEAATELPDDWFNLFAEEGEK